MENIKLDQKLLSILLSEDMNDVRIKNIKSAFEAYNLGKPPVKTKELKNYTWVCNECNLPNFTPSVSYDEIEQEQHSCIDCGSCEFHKQQIH